ncbi:MAG: DUF4423 domain-containing protein [Pseudobdellovibrionaceae bacterium]
MKKYQIFEFNDYKKYLRVRIEERPRGELSQLAEIAGCQRSYLSQVLGGKPHLTNEQAYRLSMAWNHTDLERDFFLLLLELKKALDVNYQSHLKNKITSIRKIVSDLGKVVERSEPTDESINNVYYSSWMYSALHIATAIEGGMTTGLLAQKFSVPTITVDKVMKQLSDFGYVKKKGNAWIFMDGQRHLSKESNFIHQHHMNWRIKAVQANLENPLNGLHFTNIQAISLDDIEKLKDQLLRNLRDFQSIANPSSSQTVVNFSFDFFRVDSPL